MGRYKVTGCIVTHNNMHSIKKTLDSLLEFTRADFKLYVVDNSSTDGTPEFIEQNYPQLELIRNAGNTGFGAGHNLIIDRLDSKYHVVINPDITVRDDAISALADYLEEHEDIGLLGPKICFPDGRMQILGKRDPKIKYLFASRLRNEENRASSCANMQCSTRTIQSPLTLKTHPAAFHDKDGAVPQNRRLRRGLFPLF